MAEATILYRLWSAAATSPLAQDAHTEVLRLEAENANLKRLVGRLTESLSLCAADLPDPGTEALAAIHCGRHLIYG
jgi:hypothetical protein